MTGISKQPFCSLNAQAWVRESQDSTEPSRRSNFTPQTLLRGFTAGEDKGAYLSQFLLIGNRGLQDAQSIQDGMISYGSMRVNQRVRVATVGRDYMTTWQSFIDVKNGADVRGMDSYQNGWFFSPKYRFIATPRDLATYLHCDALYQAYLNACLIMLDMGLKFDTGLPFTGPDKQDKQTGFALFGPPHILSLVTEVATRALKSVRYQKFNIHRRPRPEAVAGLVDAFKRQDRLQEDENFEPISNLVSFIDEEATKRIGKHNRDQNNNQNDATGPRWQDYDPVNGNSRNLETFLLLMPFHEGSPMHPFYGAGHATVAGACVTILKAFFDTNQVLERAFVPTSNGSSLKEVQIGDGLNVGEELNKLCANIRIGRNFAGVH